MLDTMKAPRMDGSTQEVIGGLLLAVLFAWMLWKLLDVVTTFKQEQLSVRRKRDDDADMRKEVEDESAKSEAD